MLTCRFLVLFLTEFPKQSKNAFNRSWKISERYRKRIKRATGTAVATYRQRLGPPASQSGRRPACRPAPGANHGCPSTPAAAASATHTTSCEDRYYVNSGHIMRMRTRCKEGKTRVIPDVSRNLRPETVCCLRCWFSYSVFKYWCDYMCVWVRLSIMIIFFEKELFCTDDSLYILRLNLILCPSVEV